MFLTRSVLIGVLGVPAASAPAGYDWMIMAGGETASGGTKTTTKYTFSSSGSAGTAAAGTSLPTSGSAGRWFGCAFGDKSVGVYAGGTTGTSSADVDVYTNSSDTWTAGPDLSAAEEGHEGFSSTTYGYTVGGYNGGAGRTTTKRYAYGSSAWTTNGGALNVNTTWCAVHNNTTVALRSGGYSSANQNTQSFYTFSSDTWASDSDTLTAAKREVHATGTASYSYVFCGTTTGDALTNSIYKIDLTNATISSTLTNSKATRFGDGAASDAKGVFGSYQTVNTSGAKNTESREIDWSSDTQRDGAALAVTAWVGSAFSGAYVG